MRYGGKRSSSMKKQSKNLLLKKGSVVCFYIDRIPMNYRQLIRFSTCTWFPGEERQSPGRDVLVALYCIAYIHRITEFLSNY